MNGRLCAFLAFSMLALTVWAGEAPQPKPETPPQPKPLGPTPPEIGPKPDVFKAPVPRPKPNQPQNRPKFEAPNELLPVSLGLQPLEKVNPGNKAQGELLVYDIRVDGVPAGQTRMEITRETPTDPKEADVWVAKMETRSNRAVGILRYNVRDVARSRIDVKGGFSRFYEIDMSEGDTKAAEQFSMNYTIGAEQASAHWLRQDGVWREKTVALNGKVLDPLSIIYYLRSKSLDLSNVVPNRRTPFLVVPVCADHRLQNAALFAVEKRIEDVGKLKGRSCLIVEPECEFKGLFEKKNRMRVWLDCETGVVLKMVAEIPIGSAEVILTEHKNSPLDE